MPVARAVKLDVAVHGLGVDDLAGHNIGQLCDEIVLVKLLLHLLTQRLEILGRERQTEALGLQRALVELERQGRIEMDLRVNARACDAARQDFARRAALDGDQLGIGCPGGVTNG